MKNKHWFSYGIASLWVMGLVMAVLYPGLIMASISIVIILMADLISLEPSTGLVLGFSYMIGTTLLFLLLHTLSHAVLEKDLISGNLFFGFLPATLLMCFWVYFLISDISLMDGEEISSSANLFSSTVSYMELAIRTSVCYVVAGLVTELFVALKQRVIKP